MEPKISVGILRSDKIYFSLDAEYSFDGNVITGDNTIGIQNGSIVWEGISYKELYFEPLSPNASFTLKEVIIGLNFHWERKEDQIFEGALKFIIEDNAILAINLISVENYLTSVISSEMSASASSELLKAHAVISRGWLLAQIEKNKQISGNHTEHTAFTENEDEIIRWYDREDHKHFNVCADDHCQRYQGITRTYSNQSKVKQAIKETRGLILKYEGKICDTRFSKCCGGITEEFQNCWEDIRYPYLTKLKDDFQNRDIPDLTYERASEEWIKARPEAFCNTTDKKILEQVLNNYDQETTDFYRWKVCYTQEELSGLVKSRSGIDFGLIEDLIPLQRGTSGRIVRLKISGTKKTMIIGKELEIRRILSTSHLYSSAFIVRKKDNNFIFTGAGWGHGVGLCQIGAAVMGEKGYTYNQILLHYYPGAEIVRGY